MTTFAYRFHPETRKDANDFSEHPLTDQQKQELAEMVRQGAKFYWIYFDGEWRRHERTNYAFVARVTGETVSWQDHAP